MCKEEEEDSESDKSDGAGDERFIELYAGKSNNKKSRKRA